MCFLTFILMSQSPDGAHRPPELEAALSKYEGNRVRNAKVRTKSANRNKEPGADTTSFGMGSVIHKGPDSDEDDPDGAYDDEGTWNRKYVKTQSQQNVKKKLREEAKKTKLDAEK